MAASVSVSQTSAASSSRPVSLPAIPELFNPNFLDILIPSKNDNPMMDALKDTSRQTFTTKGAPAYSGTDSRTLDAFTLSRYTEGSAIEKYLKNSWQEDSDLTLRIIWNLRSIHDGKGEKEAFYRAFSWLYDNHPRTAVANLHMLVDPVIAPPKKKKSKTALSHGYWKDLLNIVALAAVGELSTSQYHSGFLHAPRSKYTYSFRARSKKGPPAQRIEAAQVANAQAKAAAAALREKQNEKSHDRLIAKLKEPKFRALFIAVARLFAEQLLKDVKLLHDAESLGPNVDRIAYLKQLSLAAKWAPTPGRSHDRVTNIATAICELIYASKSTFSSFPSVLKTSISAEERTRVLHSFYQRWILTELRRELACPEPLMSANRWSEIKYFRVPSICMKANTESFFNHDPKGFEEYLVSVEKGKKTISGATLLPHELAATAINLKHPQHDKRTEKLEALKEIKKKLAETQIRVVEAQWKSLINNLRDSGSIENSIAVCDVSGSMGSIFAKHKKNDVQPILPAISLSLVLASLVSPPFNGGFITFSANPQFVTLDLSDPLADQINNMAHAAWGMNTNLKAVFLDLLLPLAIKNKVKQEDMIKRIFIFSDMQFDAADNAGRTAGSWETNFDVIDNAYKKAGYEVPQIVYWDLAARGVQTTKEVQDSTKKGVAMMNGFSPAMLKVFMGEEEAVVDEWEKVDEDGGSVTVAEKTEDEFNPINVMKKALMKPSFDGLVVLD